MTTTNGIATPTELADRDGLGRPSPNPQTRTPSPPSCVQIELIRAATLAPSPDNNQPWRFRFDEGKLLVYEDRGRALPSDVCSMFGMLALGAAVENVVIEATRHGLAADVQSLEDGPPGPSEIANCKLTESPRPPTPDPQPLSAVAEIRFAPSTEHDRLADFLAARCTNRHPYSRGPLAREALDCMTSAVTRFDGCAATWLTNRSAIRRLSKLVAVADRLRFEREEFHAELFRQLRLTPAEAERTRDGLDLRTLGLPPGGGLMLRSLTSWPLVRFFNHFGLSHVLTAPSGALLRKSGAIGVLTVAHATAPSFFAAGRAFQRLWLTATELGLALHPLGSLPIFVGHHELLVGRALDPAAIQNPKSKIQNRHHARLAANVSHAFRELLPEVATQTLVMAFRIGSPKRDCTRSLRREVNEVLV